MFGRTFPQLGAEVRTIVTAIWAEARTIPAELGKIINGLPGWVLMLLFLFVFLPFVAIALVQAFIGLLNAPLWLIGVALLALVVFGGGWLIDQLPRK